MKKITLLIVCLILSIAGYSQRKGSSAGLDSLRAIEDPALLEHKLKMLGLGSEKDLETLWYYYQGDDKKVDSIGKIALKRFPKSGLAFQVQRNRLYKMRDLTDQEHLLQQLTSEFPNEDLGPLNFTLCYSFANKKNVNKAIEYLKKVTGDSRTLAFITIPGIIMTYDPNTAQELMANERESQKRGSKQEYITFLSVYSEMLSKLGKYGKAFEIAKEWYVLIPKKRPEIIAEYYFLMSKTGACKAALPELEKAVVAGIGDHKLKLELRNAYQKVNPAKDVNKYMSMVDNRHQARVKSEVLSKIVDEPAPAFNVLDADGKVVSLADFKGSTIVLDFWATWCGPCKGALPAMQLAVEKYKDNPKVKFLFIHTWEKVAEPTAEAVKYFAENNFQMPLYMDLKDPATKKNPAASAFAVTGIPAKFVINAKGNIRFRIYGRGSTTDEEFAEMSEMIDLSLQTN
jgi:thiol-disulfide isomerase/thioredoxin